jgi:hypothetical protein
VHFPSPRWSERLSSAFASPERLQQGSADVSCKSAVFSCPQATCRRLTEQVFATPWRKGTDLSVPQRKPIATSPGPLGPEASAAKAASLIASSRHD